MLQMVRKQLSARTNLEAEAETGTLGVVPEGGKTRRTLRRRISGTRETREKGAKRKTRATERARRKLLPRLKSRWKSPNPQKRQNPARSRSEGISISGCLQVAEE